MYLGCIHLREFGYVIQSSGPLTQVFSTGTIAFRTTLGDFARITTKALGMSPHKPACQHGKLILPSHAQQPTRGPRTMPVCINSSPRVGPNPICASRWQSPIYAWLGIRVPRVSCSARAGWSVLCLRCGIYVNGVDAVRSGSER
jgi:hypothetical protein